MHPCLRLLTFSFAVFAADQAIAAGARAQLDDFSHGVQNLQAAFEQSVYSAEDDELDKTSGTLVLARPNRFRWDYLQPEEQRIIADGDNIWIYDVELEQVSVRPQSPDEQQSPLAVLLDLNSLDEQFTSAETGAKDGADWMRLKPKAKDPPFSHVDLGFRDSRLVRMVMVDIVGQRTEIVFADWKRNGTLAPGTFQFEPPAGVDVVGDVHQGAKTQAIPE